MYTGPHIIKDGLVFGYDTGYGIADNDTATRFYPGANTVNHTTDTPSQGGWGGSYNVNDSSRKKFRFNVSNFAANPGAGWRSFTWDLRAYTGQSVTISATVEVPDASPGTFAWIMMGQGNTHTNSSGAGGYMGYSASSERVQKTTTTKERITWSGTLGNSGTASQPSGHVGFTVWYNNGVPGTNSYVEVSDVQIELKSHETPFVNGTRSSTASLIDLKETTDIDVSNVSFDSTGQPDFDGTDDILYANAENDYPYPYHSWEVWFKTNQVDSNGQAGLVGLDYGRTMYLIATNGGTIVYTLYSNMSSPNVQVLSISGGTNLLDNEWHQVVCSRGTSAAEIWVDGSLVKTASNGGQATWDGINQWSGMAARFGDNPNNSGYKFTGPIPIIKIYNKQLSGAEVLQNYNAQKSRFGL